MTEQECKDFAECVRLEILAGNGINFEGGSSYIVALIRGGLYKLEE
jgi:urease beta subunit